MCLSRKIHLSNHLFHLITTCINNLLIGYMANKVQMQTMRPCPHTLFSIFNTKQRYKSKKPIPWEFLTLIILLNAIMHFHQLYIHHHVGFVETTTQICSYNINICGHIFLISYGFI